MKYGVVLFHTTSAAMRAEKTLASAGLSIKLIPTPREFSSDCGIALRFEWGQKTQIELQLKNARVEIDTIQQMVG